MNDAVPFVAAIVVCLVGPLLTRRVKKNVLGWIEENGRSVPGPPVIPPHLGDEQLGLYIEYAAELLQIVPTVAVTTVSIIVLLPDVSTAATALIVTGAVVATVVVDAVATGGNPGAFLRYKWHGISAVSGVGLALNAAGLIVFFLTAR